MIQQTRTDWLERARQRLAISGLTLAVLAVIVAGFILRLRIAAHDPQFPMIDENEVVEQAVAFMGGELKQHFVKYGPLTMYLLAGIYRVVAAVRGMPAIEYASLVFFRGAEHYFIARAFASFSLSLLALLIFLVLRKRAGTTAASCAATLLALPLVDVLVVGVRIDVLQAVFQGGALLALGEASLGGRLRWWLVAGAATGLGIASKPLPGLLIFPCVAAASWLAARQTRAGDVRRGLARWTATVAAPGPWLAVLVSCGLAVLGDPAILDIREFVESQRAAAALHSGPMAAGPSVVSSFMIIGLPFCTAIVLSAIGIVLRKNPRGWVALVFFAVYVAAFWGRSRHYFLVAAAVAACLVIGHGVASLEEWTTRSSTRAPSWLRWVGVPAIIALGTPAFLHLFGKYSAPTAVSEATAWVHSNIPSGTALYYIGWRGAGPALVAHDEKAQSEFGDHFGYGRTNYAFLKQAFRLGFAEYQRSDSPRYRISFYHNKPSSRKSRKTPRWVTDSLLSTARKKNRRYIIIAGYTEPDVYGLGYPWLKDAVLEKEVGKIAILRVP